MSKSKSNFKVTVYFMQTKFPGCKCRHCGKGYGLFEWIFWFPKQLDDDTDVVVNSYSLHWSCMVPGVRDAIIQHCADQFAKGRKKQKVNLPKYKILLSKAAILYILETFCVKLSNTSI